MKQEPILQEGRNCWRIRKADKLAFLVDGAAYFKALYDGLQLAREQVLMLAWDVHSRLHLIPPRRQDSELATSVLGDLLNRLAGDNSSLDVYILGWDFSLLYAPDREWMPVYKLDWKTHRRVRFCLDDKCPLGGSHHQKVVVIDDALAFAGGLDVTRGRWDTPEHRADDGRRQAVDGDELPIRPFHDIQMALTGSAAVALGDMARERWRRATGKELDAPQASDDEHWPSGLAPDIEGANVAIARTEPGFGDFEEVREVEQLYLDSIAAAHSYIYIENQFLTAPSITDALARRLTDPDGPEVVLVLPLETTGWLSQQSMDMMRVVAINTLREADKHKRLAIYYPDRPGLGELSINVHAKLMIMDDRFVRVGSANLNNRSMGLDTECDIAIEAAADQSDIQAQIRNFRNRLLSEHLDRDAGEVDASIKEKGTLIEGIEALRGGARTLQPLEPRLPEADERTLRDIRFTDPERPVNAETLLKHFVPAKQAKPAGMRILRWTLLISLLLGMAAAWRFTPLSDWLDVNALAQIAEQLQGSFIAPIAVVAGFVVGGFLMVPVTAMIVISVLVFDPVAGYLYALAGSFLSAVAVYAVGAVLGRNVVRQVAGERINEVSRQLARRGILTVLVVRVVPVAPFSVINLVAGASHIRFRDFTLGTLLGMAPGILGIALVTDRVAATLRSPDWYTIMTLIVVAAVVLAAGYMLSRRLLKLARSTNKAAADKEERDPS